MQRHPSGKVAVAQNLKAGSRLRGIVSIRSRIGLARRNYRLKLSVRQAQMPESEAATLQYQIVELKLRGTGSGLLGQ